MLYVNTQGAVIGIRGGALVVKRQGAVVRVVPMEPLVSIMLFGNIQLTTQAMQRLLDAGIDVVFLSSTGRWRGRLIGDHSRNVFVRLAQYEAFRSHQRRLELSRGFLEVKIGAQLRWLQQTIHNANRHDGRDSDVDEFVQLPTWNRPFDFGMRKADQEYDSDGEESIGIDRGDCFRAAVVNLREFQSEIVHTHSFSSLMGIEGAAAACYFGTWDCYLARTGFQFVKRSRRPARNPINALLNLGYMMVLSEVERELIAAGFDPMVGFLHGVTYGRSSLALDVLEQYRTDLVDRLVLRLVVRREVTPAHFETSGGADVRLSAEGWRVWLKAYETRMEEARPALRRDIYRLREGILGAPGGADKVANAVE